MAQPPLSYLEKKWISNGGNNSLITAATQNSDRKNVPMADRDFHRNITGMGRRVLMSLGRFLYWNVPAVRGAIEEMVINSVGHFIPQFEGANQSWGNITENWMREHDKIVDVRGAPFNMEIHRRIQVRSNIVDGDRATFLTETENGYPQIQTFPAHRIGCRADERIVQGGQFDGARITDGVILNDYGAAIGYRKLGELGAYGGTADYKDIPAKDMILNFVPLTDDQVRGISLLGLGAFDWQDAADARRFELLCQKLAASIGLIEWNEDGEEDSAKKIVQAGTNNTDGTKETHSVETIDGLTIRTLKSGTGSKLESLRNDRPTANQQAFRDDVIREALQGINWSFDFSLNPTKVGGANARLAIEKINRRIKEIQDTVVKPCQIRIDGWRVSKVMDNPERKDKKLVLFPFDPDWYKWSYQGPGELTADKKYDSDVDVQERHAGYQTLAKGCARRGDYWRDNRSQSEMETDDLLTRAGALAKKHGVKIETVITLMENPTPNGMPQEQPEPQQKQNSQTE
jgi:hypothetical protein